MDRKTIVVLGGCGQAGRAISKRILETTDASVVIADLRVEVGDAMADGLRRAGAGERISASRTDAADPNSLREVFRGADLVVVASSTTDYTENVVRACLDAGCDYFDILDSPSVADTINRFASEAQEAGRLLITQGGLAPGMIAPMVRLAHASLDHLRSARLGLALSLKATERYEQVYDVFDFIVKARPIAFERGAWRERSLKDTVTIDFGPRFGTRPAATVSMPELHALPEQLGLEELAIYYATGVTVVSFLRQYFAGDFKELTGVRMMGHIIDPEPALQDLQEMGVTVIREEY